MAASDSHFSSGTRPDRSRTIPTVIATATGYVINPLVLPPVVYGLALAHLGVPTLDVVAGVGIAAVFLGVVPLAHVVWLRQRGRVASLEIRQRRERTEPFLVGLVSTCAAFLVVVSTDLAGRRLVAILLGCHAVNTLLLFVITLRWKISVHGSAMAGAVSTLVYVVLHVPGGFFGRPLVDGGVLGTGGLLAILLLWARVQSRAHTLSQAVAGTALGLVAPYGELYIVGQTIGF